MISMDQKKLNNKIFQIRFHTTEGQIEVESALSNEMKSS